MTSNTSYDKLRLKKNRLRVGGQRDRESDKDVGKGKRNTNSSADGKQQPLRSIRPHYSELCNTDLGSDAHTRRERRQTRARGDRGACGDRCRPLGLSRCTLRASCSKKDVNKCCAWRGKGRLCNWRHEHHLCLTKAIRFARVCVCELLCASHLHPQKSKHTHICMHTNKHRRRTKKSLKSKLSRRSTLTMPQAAPFASLTNFASFSV
jgi:hypothetical protein